MARSNLGHLLSSISDLSTPKLVESLTRSASISVCRFICSSTQQRHLHQEGNPNKEQEEVIKGKPQNENQEGQQEDENDEEDDVNKETGEIGGPRGPEPTRYGDWERNGRCYDF